MAVAELLLSLVAELSSAGVAWVGVAELFIVGGDLSPLSPSVPAVT